MQRRHRLVPSHWRFHGMTRQDVLLQVEQALSEKLVPVVALVPLECLKGVLEDPKATLRRLKEALENTHVVQFFAHPPRRPLVVRSLDDILRAITKVLRHKPVTTGLSAPEARQIDAEWHELVAAFQVLSNPRSTIEALAEVFSAHAVVVLLSDTAPRHPRRKRKLSRRKKARLQAV